MGKRRKGKGKGRKGFFSDLRLPVSQKYLYPSPRTLMLLIGGVGALLLIGIFSYDIFVQHGKLVSNGPLSSNHAGFGDDCANCHTPLKAVTNDKCAVCHEKFGGDIGVHTFASHYLYRTGDFSRNVSNENEGACFNCHNEHVGQNAPITKISDDLCLQCHQYDSFNEAHPQFDFAAEDLPDDANLKFPHTLHVNRLVSQEDLPATEQACLYCHTAEADGKNFAPLNFEQHCSACHLTGSDATEWLPAGNPNSADNPGVVPFETLRSQASIQWTSSVSSTSFQRQGSQIRKRNIEHYDPWILENLRRLRSAMYSGNELADLLRSSGDVNPIETKQLYEEAIANLKAYAQGLRGSSDRAVQNELEQIDYLLKVVKSRLQDPYSPLDETKFLISAAEINPDLTSQQVSTYQGLVNNLTATCQECHVVKNATITRVQKNQNVMVRAVFDHRAHIIQRRCLECHNKIPIQEYASRNERAAPSLDNASIQNLPAIETCQTCHTPTQAANTCITCHEFHPNKTYRANLSLSLD